MSRGQKQFVIALLFVAMLGWVWYRSQADLQTAESGIKHDNISASAEAKERYGFYLVSAAEKSGIRFAHQSAKLDPKLDHIMPIVSGMGAGVTVSDFDADGWLDLYFVNSGAESSNALYRNRGDGNFEECAEAWGVAKLNQPGTGACMGSIAADYDNDGYKDLLVYKWGRPELFHNQAGKSFQRVTEDAGLPAWINANSACWLDYNRDGMLDLFIAGYWSEKIDLFNLTSTQVMPQSFEYATNGGRKYLLRNEGDGKFKDVTEEVGIHSTRWTLSVASACLTDSWYPDLVLANDYGVSELYINRGGERFEEVGNVAGIGQTPKSGMSVCFGDVFNQARQSIYITNITEPGNLVQGNNLWVPVDYNARGVPLFLNQAGIAKVERGGWSWGARFGDLNNDGWQDLFLTNGYISADASASYWYDYGKIAGGLQGLIQEARYWPPIGKQSLAGYQRKCLWTNKQGTFADIASAVGVTETLDGRAVAMADLFGRGALDVVVANQNGPALLYRNDVQTEHRWIQFELTGAARSQSSAALSNRDAIGAEVTLSWRNGPEGALITQSQVITAGDGYASQSMLWPHFGLGRDPRDIRADVRWPSGAKTQLVALAHGMVHRVNENSVQAQAGPVKEQP